ncbi:MAG TPA: gephyrin-like molybdotransferase Glp [Microbacteriaceae bacterium]|nr:gephyrin-like molybdotransferase Glp [Microbacteriaceae bacterium]
MRSVEEQQAIVLAAVRALPSERVALADALGRTLAAPMLAAVPIPVFTNSAMDGFAVRAQDVLSATAASPIVLAVVGEVPAGSPEDPPLAAGQAVRIMTGAPLPSDADTVVPVEDTVEGFAAEVGGTVTVVVAPRPGGDVRLAGADAGIGDMVLPGGVAVGALQLSAIAAAGAGTLPVAVRPRVAVISTGSELVPPGAALERGQIPESNSFVLAARIAEAGGSVVLRTSVGDDPAELAAELRRAFDLGVHAVIMSGGVSAGAYEPVKQALGPSGAMAFEKVAMQPGKPQGFGVTSEGVLLFGLPGNPVSVAVSFEVFVRPALLAMQGRGTLERDRILLPAGVPWTPPRGRRQYLPARIDRSDPARWVVAPAHPGGSISNRAGGLALAEAFAIVPAEIEQVDAGDRVEVMLLG